MGQPIQLERKGQVRIRRGIRDRGGSRMVNDRQSNRDFLIPKGTTIGSIVIKATEDADDKAARLFREKWLSFAKEFFVDGLSYLFLIVIGGYCCFVVVRHGVVSPEARTVFPMLTGLFGGVVGVIVGKATK